MKQFLPFLALAFALTSVKGFSQKVSETALAAGINKAIPENFSQHWSNEYHAPTFVNLKVNQNWYRNDRPVSLVKSAGLNLQYTSLNIGGGGLGAANHYSGKIINLYAEASLQARIRLDSLFALSIGPAAEYLISGYRDLSNSYYSALTTRPSSGVTRDSGIGRDYFNQPSYGIKVGLASEKANVGLNIYYYWTKSEASNFFTSNYMQISIFVGFRKLRPAPSEEINP